jgi:hypothetical protein
MPAKLTKIEVGFEHPAKGKQHCRECVHWQSPNRCKIVEGIVKGVDWCKRFEAKGAN